jgi:hypothetical protein
MFMFIPYLPVACLTFVLSLLATVTLADTYKWIDDNGDTHYTQQAPHGISSTIIKAPPPPTIDPNLAQKQVDKLIQQQQSEDELRLKAKKQSKVDANNNAKQQKNCGIAQQQLQQYQDNPGRRTFDSKGNATMPTEEQRQQKIVESQKKINKYCS